ncbi:MAG: hypothetical protein ABF289_12095 [Clostridiales bacterium]
MKQSPKLSKIQDKMRVGELTSEGYLGKDDRSLTDIISDDYKTVKSLGISHNEIARKMQLLTDAGKLTPEYPVVLFNRYRIQVNEYMGFMPCPFSDGIRIDKRNTMVTDEMTEKSMYWTDMNIHLIEAHGFYEGVGARYRIEPIDIVEFLKAIPNDAVKN